MTGRKEVKGNAMRASRTHSWRRAEEAPQEGEGAVDWRDKLVLGENQDEGRERVGRQKMHRTKKRCEEEARNKTQAKSVGTGDAIRRWRKERIGGEKRPRRQPP
jgi:hypothetical protein